MFIFVEFNRRIFQQIIDCHSSDVTDFFQLKLCGFSLCFNIQVILFYNFTNPFVVKKITCITFSRDVYTLRPP